jgi:hypothetical protein
LEVSKHNGPPRGSGEFVRKWCAANGFHDGELNQRRSKRLPVRALLFLAFKLLFQASSKNRPFRASRRFEVPMVRCLGRDTGTATDQFDEQLDALMDPPDGITLEQALRFRELVLATIKESEAPDSFVVSWEVTRDEWGLALTVRNFDD